MPFYLGHEGLKKENNPNWKGGEYMDFNGYKRILLPNHPKADSKGYITEHTVMAETALGKPLPRNSVVHHHNPEQLVICEDQAYHRLLHARTRIVKAGGNPNIHKICNACGELKQKEELHHRRGTWDGRYYQCRDCRQQLRRN
jgi:hypothetical protein